MLDERVRIMREAAGVLQKVGASTCSETGRLLLTRQNFANPEEVQQEADEEGRDVMEPMYNAQAGHNQTYVGNTAKVDAQHDVTNLANSQSPAESAGDANTSHEHDLDTNASPSTNGEKNTAQQSISGSGTKDNNSENLIAEQTGLSQAGDLRSTTQSLPGPDHSIVRLIAVSYTHLTLPTKRIV